MIGILLGKKGDTTEPHMAKKWKPAAAMKKGLSRAWAANTVILYLQWPELGENKLHCLSYPDWIFLLWQP